MASSRPRAIFMAFGTKGDVFPIAAIASAFASDQSSYNVLLITHSAHQSLYSHLAEKGVVFIPISTPPVLSVREFTVGSGSDSEVQSFSLSKKTIQMQHRQECLSTIERIFGDGLGVEGDFIVINFFALFFFLACRSRKGGVLQSYIKFGVLLLLLMLSHIAHLHHLNAGLDMNFHFCTSIFKKHLLTRYGFSKEIVECPGYWPSNVHVCGFWFLPMDWQFSCNRCGEMLSSYSYEYPILKNPLCAHHSELQHFLVKTSRTSLPIFVGLNSVGSMGFLGNPRAFLLVLRAVIEITDHRFILFSAGYEPLDAAIRLIAYGSSNLNELPHSVYSKHGTLLFNNQLFCFSGAMPYSWLFPRCSAVIHHGGSGSTAAALHAGTPQIVCPFLLDQFYWAERLFWLGVAPEPLRKELLVPDSEDTRSIKQAVGALSVALKKALSPGMKDQASRVSERISSEDGVGEAVKVLKDYVTSTNNEEDCSVQS